MATTKMNPGSRRTFTIECKARISAGDKISAVSVAPSPADLTVVGSPSITGSKFTMTLTGGTANPVPYNVVCTITLLGGDVIIFTIPILLETEIIELQSEEDDDD